MARAAKPKVEVAVAEEPDTAIEAVKAFDKHLRCRGFQYAIGETYTHEGAVSICNAGYHACENPLDVLNYYPLNGSRFAKVTVSGKIDRRPGEDSKICGGSITIGAELTVPDFIKAAAAWIVGAAKGNVGTGTSGHAAATGDSGHAAATGDRGHAAATGTSGHAAATGDRGHAAATGDSGHAAATGDRGHAAATGGRGHAAATGDRGHAAATGGRGIAAATGDRGHAAATGGSGIAASLGALGTATASASGAIVLAHHNTDTWPYRLTKIAAFMVGEDGVEAGKTYRLGADGKPVEVAA